MRSMDQPSLFASSYGSCVEIRHGDSIGWIVSRRDMRQESNGHSQGSMAERSLVSRLYLSRVTRAGSVIVLSA